MIIILQYKDTANPLGFPGDYPAQRMDIRDGSRVDLPWVEVTEDAYKKLVELNFEEVARINREYRDTKKEEENLKQADKVVALESVSAIAKRLESEVLSDRDRLDAVPKILKLIDGIEVQLRELIKKT